MGSCRKVRGCLPEFIGGELREDIRKEIEGHLKSCIACQREKELLNKSWALLEKWPSCEPSPDFRHRFWKRIDLAGRRREKVFVLLSPRYLLPVLASVFFILLGSYIYTSSRIEKINLIKDIELYQNLEVIQDMGLLADLEFLIIDEYEG